MPDTPIPEGAVEVVPVEEERITAYPDVAPGVPPSKNYAQAIELGHVLAKSGYFPDARDAAKASVRIMIGLDLGISPTAALTGIHYFEEKGKAIFLIEAKILAALIHNRPGYDYEVIERTEQKATLRFLRNGEALKPDVTYTIEDAKRAGLLKKDNWQKHPVQMLTWRAMAEGQRLHFPEITTGAPIYITEEFGVEPDDLVGALEERPQPLSDSEADDLRAEAEVTYDELKAINPKRVAPGRYAGMVAGAEHSHERLRSIVDTLKDLVKTEGELQALLPEAEKKMSAAEFKALAGRVERAGSNYERIEIVEAVLKGVEDEQGD